MDPEAFIKWALNPARTVEERYTTELLVERGVVHWKLRNKQPAFDSFEVLSERKRQRAFNPAYEPRYSEQDLRRAAEAWSELKQWHEFTGHDSRPVRDLAALRFITGLEEIHLYMSEVDDVSPLADLPNLKSLHFSSHTCRDLRPLARCTGLKNLQLTLLRHWPDVRGLESLPHLESLLLKGNLLVFERAVFPTVKFASLQCEPLMARNVAGFPQLPACQFLSIGGLEMLDGIESFSQLRNLTLTTAAESFEPVTRLAHLTCLTVKDHEPLDVAPLVRVPKLQYLCFNTWNKERMRPVKPRDLSPLTDSTSLRELEVIGNPHLATEAAALQAGLMSWGDLYLRPEPRSLPPWRLLAYDNQTIPRDPEISRMPEEPEQIDLGLRDRELRWANRFIERAISRRLGTTDWHESAPDYSYGSDYAPHIVSPTHRTLHIEFNNYGLLEKIPEAVEALRECLAQLRADYRVHFWVLLKVPKRPRSKAEDELEDKLSHQRDMEEWEVQRREREEYLERLYRYELKKQAGQKVNPADFAPAERVPLPGPEEEEQDENESKEDDGGVAVKEDPAPPLLDDDEHPLAREYNLMAYFTLEEGHVHSHAAAVAEYLFRRKCQPMPPAEKPGSSEGQK
jgi:hypothetical protein